MFSTYIVYFFIYSFIGWAYESIYCSIIERRVINRGFLNGPFCPIYGAGAIADILLLGTIQNPLVLFMTGAVVASILEYLTSWLLEMIFHAKWWDYSHMGFNLNGRVCLLGAVVFGAFAVTLILFIHPVTIRLIGLIPRLTIDLVALVCLLALGIDLTVTVLGILNFKEKVFAARTRMSDDFRHLQENVKDRISELPQGPSAHARLRAGFQSTRNNIENLHDAIRNLNLHDRRLLKAFPYLRFKDIEDTRDYVPDDDAPGKR
ncbi:MAG: putative ABC transporter permease [Actinobacteria bacterium]|nr:putative ABC transporter permease [Actinomycetota bacterium]